MAATPAETMQALREYNVVPEVFSDADLAHFKGFLKVHYPEHTIAQGEAIPRAGTLSQPDLEFPDADTDASYTIIMTDPDLTHGNDKIAGQVRHWLRTGVKFDPTSKRSTLSATPVAQNDYVPPSPLHGTGKHRYVFIAAKEPPSYAGPQNKNYPLNGPADLKDRMRWNASEYIQEEGLTVEAVGFMRVDADLAASKDNILLTAEAIKNAVVGK